MVTQCVRGREGNGSPEEKFVIGNFRLVFSGSNVSLNDNIMICCRSRLLSHERLFSKENENENEKEKVPDRCER